MKKIMILILLSVIILIGCSKESESWDAVLNNEWSNLDVVPGCGLYFFEDNNTKYCTFMRYGSGVHVAGHYTSEVVIDDEDKLVVQLPFRYAGGYLGEEGNDKELVRVEFIYTEDLILINDYEFEIYESYENYEHIIVFDETE